MKIYRFRTYVSNWVGVHRSFQASSLCRRCGFLPRWRRSTYVCICSCTCVCANYVRHCVERLLGWLILLVVSRRLYMRPIGYVIPCDSLIVFGDGKAICELWVLLNYMSWCNDDVVVTCSGVQIISTWASLFPLSDRAWFSSACSATKVDLNYKPP